MTEIKIDHYVFNLSDLVKEGQYTQTYRGYDTKKNNAQVAIWGVPKGTVGSQAFPLHRAMNKIRIMQEVGGRNIVNLMDILQTDEDYYLVMEYCDGGDLATLNVKKSKTYDERRANSAALDILLGYQQLLKRRYIHRNLNPTKIMIHQGVNKLGGFQFVRHADAQEEDTFHPDLGDSLFMSPQLLSGEPHTDKTDVWSFGAIFYFLLFGVSPWNGKTPADVLKHIQSDKLTFPKHQLRADYIALITGCLQVNEDARFTWEQVYKHRLWGGKFNKENLQAQSGNPVELINALINKIQSEQLSTTTLFAQYDKWEDQVLDLKEFGNLIRSLDPNITDSDIQAIFKFVDGDGYGDISIKDFDQVLNCQAEIRPTNRNADQILLDFRRKLKKANTDLAVLFKKYDGNNNGLLDTMDFSTMLRKNDPTLNFQDIQAVFRIFDPLEKGFISFSEFVTVMNLDQVTFDPEPEAEEQKTDSSSLLSDEVPRVKSVNEMARYWDDKKLIGIKDQKKYLEAQGLTQQQQDTQQVEQVEQ